MVSENNSPTVPKFNIPQTNGIVNNNSMQKSSDDSLKPSSEKQSSVMWTFSEGILDKSQISRFYTEIGKINKRGSKNYHLSADGEYIIDIDNHLIYTDGYVTISNIGDYSTDGREDGRGKGKNSGRTSSTDEIKFSIVSDVVEKYGLSELIRKYGSISITGDSSSSHTNKCIKLKNIRS